MIASNAIALVKMVRDAPEHPGAPVTADIHPKEVDNLKKFGWKIAPVEVVETPKQPEPEPIAIVNAPVVDIPRPQYQQYQRGRGRPRT